MSLTSISTSTNHYFAGVEHCPATVTVHSDGGTQRDRRAESRLDEVEIEQRVLGKPAEREEGRQVAGDLTDQVGTERGVEGRQGFAPDQTYARVVFRHVFTQLGSTPWSYLSVLKTEGLAGQRRLEVKTLGTTDSGGEPCRQAWMWL